MSDYSALGGSASFMERHKRVFQGVAAIVVVSAILITIIVVAAKSSKNLAERMEIEQVNDTLTNFYRIATENSNNRALGTAGYAASVAFVKAALDELDYDVSLQEFDVPFASYTSDPTLRQVSPVAVDYVLGVDFIGLNPNMGSGSLSAPLFAVASLGCTAADFTGLTKGDVALILRGDCTFEAKVANAVAAEAGAALIYNDGADPTRTGLFQGSMPVSTIPVYALTFALGEEFKANGTVVALAVTTQHISVGTTNVIATSKLGDENSIIVVGSHLDSVPAGPGIDDNGSGSSINLELATQYSSYSKKNKPTNKVRFCWWAAEEEGLLGSTYYVASLTPEELATIALNLNFDMLGAPNYVRYVYNGSGAEDVNIRHASATITNLFTDYFDEQSLPWELSEFNGRSDYGPFIASGIPAGGLATGAEELKTAEQRAIFGGIANAQLDTCYHTACDTIDNINWDILSQNAAAAANTLEALAYADLGDLLGTTQNRVSLSAAPPRCLSNKPCL